MLGMPIDSIDESHLQSLVTEGRREDAQLEFKLTLPGGGENEKREFLKDVSAMANSQGGDIIYGISPKSLARRMDPWQNVLTLSPASRALVLIGS
jgi:predicted HTH transcriptional regulator